MEKLRAALRCAAPLFAVAALGAFAWGVYTDGLAWLRGPAPFPEWEWPYAPRPWSRAGLLPLACGLGLLGLAAATRLASARRRPRAAFGLALLGASALGTLFQLSLIGLSGQSPAAYLLRRAVDPSITSYYSVAASPLADDPAAFLDRHGQLLPGLARTAPHAATHPPGPVLYYRAWLASFRARPRLATAWLERGALERTLLQAARQRAADPEIAAALSGPAFLVVLCVLGCWPIALWAAQLAQDRLAGARVGLLWPLLPGATLFAGSIDPALTLPVMLATSGAVAALAAATPTRSFLAALGTGVAAGLALHLSYAAVFFLGAGVLAAAAPWLARRRQLEGGWRAAATASLAALLVLAFPTLLGHEPLEALATALSLHRHLVTAQRSYAVWLVYNPIDFAVFLGPPLAALVALRVLAALRARLGERLPLPLAQLPLLVLLASTLLLLLSGLVRGEVGRIWVPLMALFLVAASAAPAHAGRPAQPTPRQAVALGGSLLAVTLVLRLSWGL